jgi:phosphate:Na+ symporter
MTASAAAELEIFPVVMGLFGGLALFLYGLDQMTAALKAVAGDRLRTILGRLTTNRFTGLATGTLVTAVIQSSSVTTVLVVSFISSGVMTLSQSVGVIMGANIGTTVTAQIVAFKVTRLALLMVALGFGVTLITRRESLQHHGKGTLGLGLVFLGMTVMGEAMAPLRDYPPFLAWMLEMERPLFGVLAGALFTALVQSSSATTGVVIAMASQGIINLPAGIALILGSNVGTCVTAMLAGIGRPREAQRAAVVHLLFNVLGLLIWVAFIPELAAAVVRLSPGAPELAGVARLAAETPRQIANAHTLFNVANALLLLPAAGGLARLATWLVPDRPRGLEAAVRARYLDEALLAAPSMALQMVRRELVRLGTEVQGMLGAVLPAMLSGSLVSLRSVERMDATVDQLHEHIIEYLGRISRLGLTQSQTRELMHLMSVANWLENIGDVIETDLVSRGRERIEGLIRVSPQTRHVIQEFHGQVSRALADAIAALETGDVALAEGVVTMKPEIQRLAERAARHQAERLLAPESDRLQAYGIETDMLENLRRIFHFAKRIAHGVIDLADGREQEAEAA